MKAVSNILFAQNIGKDLTAMSTNPLNKRFTIKMISVNKNAPVMVSGANGFVASWLVKKLLKQGFTVHATVRDKTDDKKTEHLRKLGSEHPGQLKMFNADLFNNSSFDEAMQGCEIVFHTASPFIMRGLKNPEKELIQPALQGTRNVLNSANRTVTVKRVVLTSSTVAIYGDAIEVRKQVNGKFTENVWNTTSSIHHQPYSYSKAIAEKEAWIIANNQNRWDMVTINPGFVLGPSIAKSSVSESVNTMLELMRGDLKTGVPALYFPIVDVRDVADAHINAATTPTANGRHIIVSETGSMLDMAKHIEKAFPGKFKLPKKQVPKFMIWLFGPLLKVTRKFVKLNVGYNPVFDNSRARNELGLRFRPIGDTIAEHAQQIVEDGLLN